MISKLLISFFLMGCCVIIHAIGLTAAFRWMESRLPRATSFLPATWMLIRLATWAVLLHLIQILAWAFTYTSCHAITDFPTAAYFSAVTYTTTGYGDILLPQEWRLVGGIEALAGILMCGLSSGLFFAAFAHFLGLRNREPSLRL